MVMLQDMITHMHQKSSSKEEPISALHEKTISFKREPHLNERTLPHFQMALFKKFAGLQINKSTWSASDV